MFLKWAARTLAGLIFAVVTPGFALAEQVSILQTALFQNGSQALIEVRQTAPEVNGTRSVASLFAGREGGSLFAPYPLRQRQQVRQRQQASLVPAARSTTQIEQIRVLIAKAEAGSKGYDAVQYGAVIRPAKRPTEMSIQEIYDWIAATPGQPHAIGLYQFIPPTLKRLVTKIGASPYQLFTPQLQDQLGDVLLVEAGLNAFNRGDMERHTFMHNLAKIWAGLPTSSGQSYYHGYAGNKATMTWAYFDREMGRIFPS